VIQRTAQLRLSDELVARGRKIDNLTQIESPVCAAAYRPLCVRVLHYIPRSCTSSESAGNGKEFQMYIGSGLLLVIILLLVFVL
jgi:hypothetical protein